MIFDNNICTLNYKDGIVRKNYSRVLNTNIQILHTNIVGIPYL